MLDISTYIQANEQINGENGAPGEVDVANRPLKELVALFNEGNADTQVRRINFKIAGAQEVADGVVSDDVVWFNNTTGKYELATWDSTQAMGFIDVEALQIYSFGEYTFKNINTLVPGLSYSISKSNAGKIVPNTDTLNSSYSHMGVARDNNVIEINKFVDSVFDSVTINDVTASVATVYSSSKTEAEITNRATKIYYFTNTANNTSLAPNPTKLYNIPLNSTLMDLTSNQIYTKKSNNGITINSALSVGLSSGSVTKLKIDWSNIVGTPSFANVATSGSYNDLSNKPANVTTTTDGFMSKDDKTKLNSINPEVGSVVSSVVRRGTDGSIIAGGTSNFGNITASTVTANLTGSATRLNGLDSSSSSTGNTVAVRDTGGDIRARLFRSDYDTTNPTCNYFMTQVDTVDNNYIRPSTSAQVTAALQITKTNSAQALHATDALRITGDTIYLYKGNGTSESVTISQPTSLGAIGTYAFLKGISGANASTGSLKSGAELAYTDNFEETGTSPTGTWRCMGKPSGLNRATVWLRIA